MPASYAFSWDAAPLGWPAGQRGHWSDESFKTPLPCREGAGCTYPGVCSFVHPGEEGRCLKFFAGRTRTEGNRQIWEPPTVRLWVSREERAPFYERRSVRLSWAAWCEREGIPYQAGQRPDYALRAEQRSSGGRRETLQLTPAAAALAASSDEEGVVEFTEEEMQLGVFAPAAEASLTLRAIHEDNLRQQQSLYRQALERSHAAWTAQWQAQMQVQQQLQQQAWAAWQQQQERQQIGEQLFVNAQGILQDSAADREVLGFTGPLFTPGKIIGMILEAHSLEDLRRIVQSDAEFSELLMDACQVLKEAQQAQLLERLRAARQQVLQNVRPAVPGNEAMAAAADDTIRELLEDIRREDAGLPPLDRPPSMTSYTPAGAGVVIRREIPV